MVIGARAPFLINTWDTYIFADFSALLSRQCLSDSHRHFSSLTVARGMWGTAHCVSNCFDVVYHHCTAPTCDM
jgi:hypothetical protein